MLLDPCLHLMVLSIPIWTNQKPLLDAVMPSCVAWSRGATDKSLVAMLHSRIFTDKELTECPEPSIG